MFWGVFNAFLGSVSGIFWKKSLTLSLLSDRLFYGLGMVGSIALSLAILSLGYFTVPSQVWFLALPVADALVVSYGGTLSQRIYKEEKISALLPFENLSSIFTIIAAFFLFPGTPLATLAIAIVTVALIFTVSYDFKSRHFPKNFKLLLLSNSIGAGRSLAMGYALSHLTSSTFYSTRNLMSTVVVFVPLILSGQIRSLAGSKREFLIPRLSASVLGAISALIGFTLISKFWIVTSTLLGFFSMASTLLLWHFFLGDHPERKSIALAVAVSALVAFWTYLKVSWIPAW